MGVDDRPTRTSKVRAMQRVSQQQLDEEDPEPGLEDDLNACSRSKRRKRQRTSHRSAVGSSDDDDEHQLIDEEDEDQDDDFSHPTDMLEYTAPPQHPSNIHPENSHDDDSNEFPDASEERNLSDVYMPPITAAHVAAGSVVTKSGRLVKKPAPLSPSISPAVRQRRNPPIETRSQRWQRRSRGPEGGHDVQYIEREPPHARTRAGKSLSHRIDVEMEDDEIDEEEYMEKDDDIWPAPRPSRSRATRSHAVKIEDHEVHNGHRRVSTRARASSNPSDPGQLTYDVKGEELRAPNGERRSRRVGQRRDLYVPILKNSDGEVEGDGDYPSPGPGDDSDELDERGFDDHEVLDEEHHRGGSESGYDRQRRSLRRSTRTNSKRVRKAEPQRSVPAKRRVASKRRAPRPVSSSALDARKSYRPRRESVRPADFYPEVESSENSFSSEDAVPEAKRLRPTRAAASRAGDAIANKLAPEDYLQNPMSTLDTGLSLRPSRSGRYSRRRNRLRPTGNDPLASDGDDPHGAPSNITGIEPIKVDLSLSWDDVGGLDHHVRALKEMVSLPLLYPEIFEKFDTEAPRGVLFFGPPGTGKTLCARALAASCGAAAEPVGSGDTIGASVDQSKGENTRLLKTRGALAHEITGEGKGLVNADVPNPDVVMADAQSREHKIIGENGLPVPTNPDGDGSQIQPRDTGVGPHTLAKEHEGVITKRREEVQNRLQNLNDNSADVLTNGGDKVSSATTDLRPAVKKKPRVSFFMRNGADCLSKWVGEAERQLRMTFEAAKKHQPSIIFFDEIDGLAPVRSSRQDQIHSSIVSTLLGLMDGLDARGKVVVIGATNRIDSIDPALRRPGRFDRELIFTLPNVGARRKILGIHTASWKPPPAPSVLNSVAKITTGYCGADLKSLCSEAAIRALRRRYPQIYESRDKLIIDVDQVKVSTRDFLSAMKEIVPSSHRSARTYARPISERLSALLNEPMQVCISILRKTFPQGMDAVTARSSMPSGMANDQNGGMDKADGAHLNVELKSDSEDDEDEVLNFEDAKASIPDAGRLRPMGRSSGVRKRQTLRPRLLVCGMQGLGQAQIGPALLHICESSPVHSIDFPSLHADPGARCPEEALTTAFREALRSVPSVLYLPHLQLWWESAQPSLRTTLIIALKDLPADLPLLVLATAETPLNNLPPELTEMFGETLELSAPSEESRKEMFEPLLQEAQAVPMMSNAAAKNLRRQRKAEILPLAPPSPPKEPTVSERGQKMQLEDRFIRRLRMDMRAFVETLLRDRRFKAFWLPVDPLSAPDYYDIIKVPMDISKIAAQIDLGKYPTVLAMVNDFDIMVRNAIQYNPPNTEMGAAILRRAHGLIDIVHAWVDNLNPAIIETCNKIVAERVARCQKELDAKESGLAEAEKGVIVGQKSVDDPSVGDEARNVEVDVVKSRQKGADESVVICEKADRPSYVLEVNGRAEKALLNSEGDSNDQGRVIAERPGGQEDMDEEPPIAAKRSDVAVLRKMLMAVSTGLTVDGLEGLYVRCSEVLYEKRRCMNRAEVVHLLMETVNAARDDPAVVGRLVA